MLYPGILIAFLIIISGLVAFLGDRVGRKVGKKRLSLFGLRPRHTSVIITIVTGALIASLSITILLATSRNVRTAIFNLQGVLSDLAALSLQVQQRDAQLQERDTQLREMEEEIQRTEEELGRIRQDRTQLESELDETTREYLQVTRELEEITEQLEEVTGEYNKVSGELEEVALELASVSEELETAKEEIFELEEDKAYLTRIFDEQTKELENLLTQRRELEGKVDSLEEKTQSLESAYMMMEEEYEARFQELGRLYQALGERYQEYAEGDIIYLRGDEIHWALIEGGQEEMVIWEKMEGFVQEANDIAQARGVELHDPETGRSIVFYANEFLAVARELRQREGRFIMRLVAENNATPGEHLRARFQLIPDYIVFEAGETILVKEIETRLAPHELERELEGIFNDLRTKALESGVLPDAHGYLGTIDFIVFYELLDELKEREGALEVSVVASENIWRSDNLNDNIGFKVLEVGGEN